MAIRFSPMTGAATACRLAPIRHRKDYTDAREALEGRVHRMLIGTTQDKDELHEIRVLAMMVRNFEAEHPAEAIQGGEAVNYLLKHGALPDRLFGIDLWRDQKFKAEWEKTG